MKNKTFKPKIERYDIYNNLPTGAKIKIAKDCNCHKSCVTMVLQGKRKDTKGIIKAAEALACVHVWKTRFCKLAKSQL